MQIFIQCYQRTIIKAEKTFFDVNINIIFPILNRSGYDNLFKNVDQECIFCVESYMNDIKERLYFIKSAYLLTKCLEIKIMWFF